MPIRFDATYLENIFMRTVVDSYESWVERYCSSKRPSVVVPVYGHQPELLAVLSDKGLLDEIAKLVIVFDAGPKSDEIELKRVISHFQSQKVLFLRNQRNLGFPRSVNIGLDATDGDEDLIILNSDAYINGITVKRLRQAVALSDRFATLSPLSCSNGHYSLKVSSEAGIKASDFAPALVSIHNRLSLMNYGILERVPANNGFCLYITRSALNKVGKFDHLLFARGYGEETDFCLRATECGFSHHVVLTAFGNHRGGKSFGAEREHLKRRNFRILQSTHPTFHADLGKYEKDSIFRESLPKAFMTAPDFHVTGLSVDPNSSLHTVIDDGIVKINPRKLISSKLFDYIAFCAIKFGINDFDISYRRSLTPTQQRRLTQLSTARQSSRTG